MRSAAIDLQTDYSLAAATTFGVGGAAKFFVACPDTTSLQQALAWANSRGEPVFVLGGGSNLLVADSGYPGLVVQPRFRGFDLTRQGSSAQLRVEAGANWDDVVARAVAEGYAGIEALAGIPGSAGAAPIQNIGAYGQEIASSLRGLELWDRQGAKRVWVAASACEFAYRQSAFKRAWRDRYVVLAIELELPRADAATVHYPELHRRLRLETGQMASLPAIREAVLGLRADKAMLFDPSTSDGRSAGSFFLNPIVSAAEADRIAELARRRGCQREMPRFAATAGVKLSAAWLIEEAGFTRGWGEGPAGLSSRHTLAIVNRGGAHASDIVAVAQRVWRGVQETFGVELEAEPIFLGFEQPAGLLLRQAVREK